MLCVMQLTSAFLVEVLNLFLLTGQRKTIKSITGFLTVKTISEIDNLFLSAITDPTLTTIKKAAGESSWTPVVVYPKVLWKDREVANKAQYSILKVVVVMYKTFYFYFFPFLMLYANY